MKYNKKDYEPRISDDLELEIMKCQIKDRMKRAYLIQILHNCKSFDEPINIIDGYDLKNYCYKVRVSTVRKEFEKEGLEWIIKRLEK